MAEKVGKQVEGDPGDIILISGGDDEKRFPGSMEMGVREQFPSAGVHDPEEGI